MTLSDNEYDELGRLLTDRREGSGLLTARYSYDIHSHIRKMVSPLFCQRLFYAEAYLSMVERYRVWTGRR